ncbi:TVP38/TMEM64 family protein [Aquibacillus sp. 3ASR75-11]|uniref:TVP38/TMEM64 family membrane protein n=1 Tax=Terrihalobacillus insolitus TaxID=2950438 RepID=A0A9X3WU32_9BACI|nr:TVP38/TMEM64 family protein [Terrihalobacillus insolitus]MDC3413736.1 TVP38/TMEM64 family protein [Terrihalobacillus insolitus]MDC3425595.1 TVP38/TMEM64 family protein [Terrihalobacillus insolitus]
MFLFNIDLSDIKQMVENNTFDEFLQRLLDTYESYGPIPGVALPFIEALLPFLPLVVFVMANSAAYGLFEGFILSWIGASGGAIVVFLMVKKLGNKRLFRFIRRNKQVTKVTTWFDKHGFGPLFLLMCFPFSPSGIINVVAGLSKINIYQFILAVLLGKSVMIFTISYVGASIMSFAKNPMRTIVVGAGILLFWIVGKFIEKRLHKKAKAQAIVEQKHG